jgi:hypothetical protein
MLTLQKPWNLLDVTIKSEQSSLLSSSDLIRNQSSMAASVKSELFDSSSQPALGAAGVSHWKCHQCKVPISRNSHFGRNL